MKPTQTTVTRLQPTDADAWQPATAADWGAPEREPVTNAIQRSRHAYVPAQVAPAQWQPPELARGDQAIMMDVPRGATVATVVTGSYQDRAAGFLKYTLPLSITFSVTVTLFAIWMTPLLAAAAPVAVLRTLVLLFATFCAAYLAMFAWHLKHTPEGQALKETGETWAFLRREQAHRHAIEREAWDRYIERSDR